MSRWIGVAMLDWSGEALTHFYPEDIPEEWQLTWLANHAMAVVISPEHWLNVSEHQVRDWVAQTQENFWFYLLCDTEDQLASARTVAGYFPQQCGGIVTRFVPQTALHDVAVLVIGDAVLSYQAETLRQGQKMIREWLTHFQGDHGLILLTGEMRTQVQALQSLLALLGVSYDG